ncbi:helix-turn-helix transcriptional regulator [Alkalibacterium sp. MB6]|uniref:helix-turn-helix transcriptional regulator n=1 Tax=Alkalibacterium sp. MB6 TaxID=2081965 RepID=UPI001379BBFD|nr:helix-turn-helix transcriptional regulator [Alkalibacterium sp. MB6]
MNIADALKKIRSDMGITQQEAAKRVGISRSYFADLESGRYYPSGRILIKMNDEFDIFILLTDDGKTIHYKEVN